MNVGLIGFGKTGKAVANTLLSDNDINLKWIFRKSNLQENYKVSELLGNNESNNAQIYSSLHTNFADLFDSNPVDIIIDFSSEESILNYGEEAAKRGIKIISAVSNYSEKTLDFIKYLSTKTTMFWSPNITIGVNYLLVVSKFMKKIAPDIDIQVIEEHFKGKSEVSGTAKILAKNLDVDSSDIKSIRAGGIVGKHEIIFGFPYQTVRLTHDSISREAFGTGVIFVAKNLISKDKGFYDFEQILSPYFSI